VTRIQQVKWELTMDYLGHPYYVSGNAIYHALADNVSSDVHRTLHASHGMFVPGQFGTFPEEHSKNGIRPYLGNGLPAVDAYNDLFLFRHPDHPWLLDSRPRDALNGHRIRTQHRQPALAYQTIMGRPEEARSKQQTTHWYVSAYLHADESGVLPLDDETLDGLQFGGQRNYGYGTTSLADTQIVDLDALDYSRLEETDAYLVELVTPFVLASEYPGANDSSVPWWWSTTDADDLRCRAEKVVEDREAYDLTTVDHGQVVGYDGDRPIATARNGLRRVGTHSKCGFGELRIRPVESREKGLTAEGPEERTIV
jgi:hypothetical protein